MIGRSATWPGIISVGLAATPRINAANHMLKNLPRVMEGVVLDGVMKEDMIRKFIELVGMMEVTVNTVGVMEEGAGEHTIDAEDMIMIMDIVIMDTRMITDTGIVMDATDPTEVVMTIRMITIITRRNNLYNVILSPYVDLCNDILLFCVYL